MFPIISPFTSDWISFTILFFGIFGLIGSSELVRIKLGWKPEVSRKLVHILAGSMALGSPFIFVSNLPPTILGFIFFTAATSVSGYTKLTFSNSIAPVLMLLNVRPKR